MMKKSERLNDMLRFLNDREFFNLYDLMEKYDISKSTALRDIESLEQLGVPIYAEHGRYGRYGILQHQLLAPILFTMDEIYALYFAMLTLKSYQSTPFHLSVKQLNEKFEACLSQKQLQQIHLMKKVLQFEVSKHHHVSQYLDRILKSILHKSTCMIQYVKGQQVTGYHVQFFKISAKFGQWYASGIDIKTQQTKVFRCDRITSLQEENSETPYSIDDLLLRSLDAYQSANSIEYEVEITEQAKDMFYKENYPSMSIEHGAKTIVRGYYNPGEESFITNYFMRFGSSIIAVKPNSLKKIMVQQMENLMSHYRSL
ncbi:YafY family transcriptional regulator [Paenibacillus sp. ACRSA]|uniref:helix-turn-helix transcriptional regulator n=1 Tax=Paenibacillus sp. ACRSA TaxID=2918211 RepID=UPI001EF69B07|nr:YafY family protein [Paenibacillus sp. ACRSA]MCG7376383.1 YafY family transcriptional regulator [Paenibacillus sp. ACRSA]